MGWVQRNAFSLVAAAMLVVAGVSFGAARSAQEVSLTEQERQIEELQDRKAELVQGQDDMEREVADQVLGTNAARLGADEELINQVLNTALSWDSHAEYVDARNTMMATYELGEGSAFMRAFLPEPPMNVDNEGTEYALIDLLGLDSRVKDFRSEVLSVQGVEYTYLVLVQVQSTSDDGKASASSTSAVLLSTDGQDGVADLEGYASTSPVRSSGPD